MTNEHLARYPHMSATPKAHDSCFIAPDAVFMGDVEIGEGSSIWYQCMVRGDVNYIRIGKNTNIQDGTMIHVASEKLGDLPTIIGDNITVGHMALLHACTVEDEAFIGMKAMLLDGSVVERRAMVAAGAVVTPGKVVKSGELWAGTPAKFMRKLTDADYETMAWNTEHYVYLAQAHKAFQEQQA